MYKKPEYNTPNTWFEEYKRTRIDRGLSFYVPERLIFVDAEEALSKTGFEAFMAMVDEWRRRN